MTNKISVIVSCYNTEKYVEKCLNSLLNQTYQNIEIILIDDASQDNTLKILKKYTQNNLKIKLFENKTNKGLAYSRNLGMKKATGEYLGFIDSDDYIAPDYYENLMASLINKKADLAICDMKLIYETKKEEIVKACNNPDNKLDFVNNGLAASACNKLFKKELIKKYYFEEGKINEDLAVVIPAIISATKIAYVENVFYNYIQREKSIQNSTFSDKRFEIFDGVKTTLSRIPQDEYYAKYKDAIIYNQLIVLFIYKIIKIEDFWLRKKYIKKFVTLSKDYAILSNNYLKDFLAHQAKKYQIFYKCIFKLSFTHFYLLANLMVSFSRIVKRIGKINIPPTITMNDLIKLAKKQKNKKSNLSISAVIPNYNYGQMLFQRVYSILYQTQKVSEIIILDDDSTDDSPQIIAQIVEELKPYISLKTIYNKKNSGSPFKQWKKGFELAQGDYIWIAEADDYCDKHFLESVVKPIKNDSNIIISFCDTSFIKSDGSVIIKNVKNEVDIQNSGHWNKNYVIDSQKEFASFTYLNCTIPNVSGALIKKDDYAKEFEYALDFHQAGDWIFYANLMQRKNKKIAYVNKALNYYRIHDNNISLTFEKGKHMEEIKKIHEFFDKNYGLSSFQKQNIQKRYEFLKNAWKLK